MSCPPNSLAGFANLTTIPGTSDLNTIAANTYPFIMNFAPRTTPLTIQGNTITEDPNNTLLYKGTQYYLLSTTICKPSLGSYELYGTAKQSQGSLIYTYISSTFNSVTANFNAASKISNIPLVMILILPIFQGNPTTNAPYLTQLKNPPTDTSKFMSMQGLFANLTSISYSACIDLVLRPNTTPTFGCTTSIYNFTDGITIQGNINSIMNVSPPPYMLFQNNAIIIQAYNADGSPIFTNSSSSPVIMPPISVTDNNFTNKMRYYLLPIATPQSSTAKPTNLTPDQYQCFPFDELQNLQTDANGIKTVGDLGEVLKSQNAQNNTVGAMLSWDQIGVFVIIILSVIGAFIVFGFILWAISFFSDRKIPVPEVPAAAVGATATTAPATAAPAPAPAPGASV
jgi:hypothetical protein